jgi:hypothetical protein
MSKYSSRTNYFKALAIADPHIQHTASITVDGEAQTRNSFIQVAADQDTLNADTVNSLHYPFFVQIGFNGGLSDRDGDIRNRNSNRVQFLTKAAPTDASPLMEDAIQAAKDLTYTIMKAWLNKMMYDSQNDCPAEFKRIEFNGISWQDIGPILDNFYGWELTFTDDDPAHDVTDYQPDYWQ